MEEEEDETEEGAPAWMATFADMMSLLLTFFVLLLSFANMDVRDFQLALGSVRHALGVKTKRPGYLEARHTTPIEWDHESEKEDGTMGEQEAIMKIEAIIRQRRYDDHIKLKVTENNIILMVYDLFSAGSADLDPRKIEELTLLVDVCNLFEKPIVVEAHTDNQPIRTDRFSSNWELSAVRAGAVTRFLAEGGVADYRLTASGLAHLRPIASNANPKGRARNRRVAIVIARKRKTKAQVTEPSLWK